MFEELLIRELMSKKPEDMTMADHRLKGLYVRYKKTMKQKEAWERAVEEAGKIEKRARREYPRFSPEEKANINAYKSKELPTRLSSHQ